MNPEPNKPNPLTQIVKEDAEKIKQEATKLFIIAELPQSQRKP
jgi:hypothetical protein